jgi:hypothetical protein
MMRKPEKKPTLKLDRKKKIRRDLRVLLWSIAFPRMIIKLFRVKIKEAKLLRSRKAV